MKGSTLFALKLDGFPVYAAEVLNRENILNYSKYFFQLILELKFWLPFGNWDVAQSHDWYNRFHWDQMKPHSSLILRDPRFLRAPRLSWAALQLW